MEKSGNGAGAWQADHSGLQVVPADGTLPEAVSEPLNWKQEGGYAYAYALPPGLKLGEHGAPEMAVPNVPEVVVAPVSPTLSLNRPWFRRKRWILFIIVAVLVVVGAVVGGIVGTRSAISSPPPPSPSNSSSSSGPEPPNSNNTQRTSGCGETLCLQILAAALEEADNNTVSDASLHLFARGVDNAIWHTSTALSSSSSPAGGPLPYAPFTPFFVGPFLSQPAALAWGTGAADSPRRVGVFALSDPDRGVRMKTLHNAGGPAEDVGGPVAGPVAVCLVNGARPDLWSVDLTGVAHNFLDNATLDLFWSEGRNVAWQGSAEFDTLVKGGRPGVVCRQKEYMHDVVVFGEPDGAVRHSTWSKGSGWTQSVNRGGKFQGEPLVVGVGNERFDFFGVGEDKAMYHFVWTERGGYTVLENLGGSFVSVPSAAVTGGERLDVVALGSNGTLLHRVLQGLKWANEWEDLGVFASSAPLLVNFTMKSTAVEKVAMFVVGKGGEVNHTTWTASLDLSWKNLVWTSLGGNMTAKFLF